MTALRGRWPLWAALALAACATAVGAIRGGTQADRILFPHSVHARAKVECIACHETIYDAKDLSAAANALPDEAKCLECHKEQKTEGKCSFCHSDVKFAAAWPKRTPHLKLDHAAHIERVKEDCSKCHGRLYEPNGEVPLSDGHNACFACHEHEQHFAQANCAQCHVDLKQYQLKPIAEFSHQGDFLRRHATAARAEGASCATCHEQNYCLDCHARTAMTSLHVVLPDRPDRSFIHRNDFISRHPIEARADPASCLRCHAPSSCEQCHRAENVAPTSLNARSPHPSGWVLPGSGAFHGDAARRDIANCASCHDQGAQSNCVQCHKSGGFGGDPHPAGFGRKHSLQEVKSNGTCLACHSL